MAWESKLLELWGSIQIKGPVWSANIVMEEGPAAYHMQLEGLS